MRASLLSGTATVTCVLIGAALPHQLDAQGADVVQLGRIHGVRPPSGFFDVIARNPTAYEFEHVWKEQARQVRAQREALVRRGDYRALNAHLRGVPSRSAAQMSGTAVSGTFILPVLAGYFADSTHAAQPDTASLRNTLFSTAAAPPYSVSTYYDEASNGLLTATGSVLGWFRADSASTWYEGPNNGLNPSTDHTGTFIRELIAEADPFVNFALYDGNSDGYVDLLTVLHPLVDGACGSSHIWSHRWVLSAWGSGSYLTDDGVLIQDYIIQPAVGGPGACDANMIMAIGTLTHELGHGMLDLPDLYDTGVASTSEGVGYWDLMSSGNWNTPTSPAHLSAWSKDDVGWIAIDTASVVSGSGTRGLRPIIHGDTALRVAIAGTTEYFLLENRHRIGSDAWLRGEGLLIWHVAPDLIAARRWYNEVNAVQPHGLVLEQADGLDDLGHGIDRGDLGDPYPGSASNTTYGACTVPSSELNDGTPTGVTIDSITVNFDKSIAFRLSFDAGQPVAITSDTLRDGIMGAPYSDTLTASGGLGCFVWSLAGGDELPAGLTLAALTGVIDGVPETDGEFAVQVQVTSGAFSQIDTVSIRITRPIISLQDAVDELITPLSTLTPEEQRFLDLIGNDNGRYDVGDFRAYLQDTGVIPDIVPALLREADPAPALPRGTAGNGGGR